MSQNDDGSMTVRVGVYDVAAGQIVYRSHRLPAGQNTLVIRTHGANDAEPKILLLPVEEPDRSETDDGLTSTYLRSSAAGGGDEPELHQAAMVSPGSTERLDQPSFVDVAVTVRFCLEVVPEGDLAASDEGNQVRVHGRVIPTRPLAWRARP